MQIDYMTEPVPEYAKLIRQATTRAGLKLVTEKFRRIAADADAAVDSMHDNDFSEFRAGLARESRGNFAVEKFAKKWGAILMPEVMFRVSIVAEQYKVPWGCAFVRLRDCGQIKESSGIATIVRINSAPAARGQSR